MCRSDGENLIAVVADGAGSSRNSDEGAEIVVTSIASRLAARVPTCNSRELEESVRDAISEARTAVYLRSEERGIPAREFASTIIVVAANDAAAVCAHLGDGLIAVSEGGSEWNYAFWPQRGEFANSTFFLTDVDALDRLCIDTLPPRVTDFALMSDGLEPLALTYGARAVHDPFFNSLFAPLHRSSGRGHCEIVSTQLVELLASSRITSRVDDDLSIVLASRRSLFSAQE